MDNSPSTAGAEAALPEKETDKGAAPRNIAEDSIEASCAATVQEKELSNLQAATARSELAGAEDAALIQTAERSGHEMDIPDVPQQSKSHPDTETAISEDARKTSRDAGDATVAAETVSVPPDPATAAQGEIGQGTGDVEAQPLRRSSNKPWKNRLLKGATTWLSLLALGMYLFSRCYIVVECFLALGYAPDAVFEQPNWSRYWPHIS